MRNNRVPWEGRDEDKADESVWAVTCLLTRAGFRKRGVSRALAAAAVEFARDRGARALEAYPINTKDVITEELHVGTVGDFAAAGLTEVNRPTLRRVVMRIELQALSHPGGLERQDAMDSPRSPQSLSELLNEVADLAGGLGVLLPLFPLALPAVGLVLVPLAILGLLAALLALPLVAPVLLIRALMRRRTRLAGVSGQLRISATA